MAYVSFRASKYQRLLYLLLMCIICRARRVLSALSHGLTQATTESPPSSVVISLVSSKRERESYLLARSAPNSFCFYICIAVLRSGSRAMVVASVRSATLRLRNPTSESSTPRRYQLSTRPTVTELSRTSRRRRDYA